MFTHRIPRIFLPLLLLIGLIGMVGNPSLATGIHAGEGEVPLLYLPIVVKPPLVDLVVTSAGDAIGYPGYVWLNGYVNSLVSKPVFSVNIKVEYLLYPYCEPPDPCEPYEMSEIVHPAFPATLLGQLNPFLWEFMYAKDYASVVQVKVLSASLNNDSGRTYYPLTVLSWQREDKAVIGRVRNDSGKNLGEARVVVFPHRCDVEEFYISNICRWREATLTNTNLRPGQETDFSLDSFYYEGDDVVALGQGSTVP